MRVLITGAGGLVGRALTEHFIASGDKVSAYDHSRLDIADDAQVETIIERERPAAVINCAAWTDVDGCESNARRAKKVNAVGPENLARACRRSDALLITISTDYVFDGMKQGFYTQRDNPNPQSVYAHSKLEGEQRAQKTHARTVVVRTGYVFGRGGRNFLSTIVERARRGERLKAISDAWGTPTYAGHLAVRLRELALLDLPGIFHVVNSGDGTTYEEFARVALNLAHCSSAVLEAVETNSLDRPACRPRNSKLQCLLSEAISLTTLPPWQKGLSEFLERKTPEHGRLAQANG